MKWRGSAVTRAFGNIALLVVSVTVGLAALEFSSRALMPLRPTATSVSVSGEPVEIYADQFRFVPNLRFYQVSNEFRSTVTISPQGHRIPVVQGNPDVVFVGDSFTFGYGLSDEDTFPLIYCRRANLSCANLGRPGTGTVLQLQILEHFLKTEGWRPKQVLLFPMVMSNGLVSGNDLFDNLGEHSRTASDPRAVRQTSESWDAADTGRSLLSKLNLVRLVYFHAAPFFRSFFTPEPEQSAYKRALDVMAEQLRRLDSLSREYGFEYAIFVLHPIQDVLRGTAAATYDTIRRLAVTDRMVPTAQAFESNPRAFYFAYDGHLNPRGSLGIADLLTSYTQENGFFQIHPATSQRLQSQPKDRDIR